MRAKKFKNECSVFAAEMKLEHFVMGINAGSSFKAAK